MKTRKPVLALFLGLLIVAAALSSTIPQTANAQQICTDPATGAVIPCPPPPREKRTKRPTPVPRTRTPTPTSSPTPTATPVGIPLTGGDAGGAAPAVGGTPAVQLTDFAAGGFLIGLLILVLLLGGVFDPRKGLFKRFGLFGHSTDTGTPGRNDGHGQLDLFARGTDGAVYTRAAQHEPDQDLASAPPANPAEPGTTGLGEVGGNDIAVNTAPGQTDYIGRNDGGVQQVSQHNEQTGTTMHESGHDLDADHDGLNQNWEDSGDIDMNTDGTNTAEQGDTSSSMRKPPDEG